jgi:CDP-diacylglycerol--serine O-phosphatidyltransferase
LFAIFYVLCGAFRLARFTVQKSSFAFFTGMPITAAGSLVATYVLSGSYVPSWGLSLMSLVLSGLMVSSFPYPKLNRIAMLKHKSMMKIVLVGLVSVGLVVLFVLDRGFVPFVLMLVLLGYAAYGVLRAVISPLWRHFHKNRVEFDLHPVKR